MRDPAEFVEGFRRFWAAPSLEKLPALLSKDVLLNQPLAPPMRGLDEVRGEFRPIFEWLPDFRGEVDRWAANGNVILIELRLRATIGGKPFEWPLVDRFVLGDDGLATERVTYFDSLPLILAVATRPSTWSSFLRSGAASGLFRRKARRVPAESGGVSRAA